MKQLLKCKQLKYLAEIYSELSEAIYVGSEAYCLCGQRAILRVHYFQTLLHALRKSKRPLQLYMLHTRFEEVKTDSPTLYKAPTRFT